MATKFYALVWWDNDYPKMIHNGGTFFDENEANKTAKDICKNFNNITVKIESYEQVHLATTIFYSRD